MYIFIKKIVSVFILLSFGSSLFAQKGPKPTMFNNFPNSILISVDKLEKAFQYKEGQFISITLSGGFIFSGEVISNVRKYKNLHTVLISSPSFDNAIFQISKQINTDQTVNYVGRILNDRKSDGYKLGRENGDQYYLTKFDASEILPYCGH